MLAVDGMLAGAVEVKLRQFKPLTAKLGVAVWLLVGLDGVAVVDDLEGALFVVERYRRGGHLSLEARSSGDRRFPEWADKAVASTAAASNPLRAFCFICTSCGESLHS
jgi:hypothetical protein